MKGQKTANILGMPYIRMQAANHLFVQAADDFLTNETVLKNQTAFDAALIFEDQVCLLKEPGSYLLNFSLVCGLEFGSGYATIY